MNSSQIHTTFKLALNFLSAGKLKYAFDKTRILIDELQWGEFNDRFDDLKLNYKLLLQYYVNGTEDPERKIVYNKIKAKLFVLLSDLREELLLRNSSNFEYTQKRYFPHKQHFSTLSGLFDSLNYFHTQTEIYNESGNIPVSELKNLRSNYEKLLPELFSVFWLSSHYNADEKSLFQQIMDKKYPGLPEKSLTVSALTLNLWRMFDDQKLMLLFDCCQSENQQVKQRALTGLCFVLAKYNRFIPNFPAVRNRLVLIADDNQYQENFRNIIIQIIATLETEKISKKLREEILPEIMKISPLLKDKMDAENLLKSDEWEEGNPEWQDLLAESGISDKLKELTELQMEGADVYMSTFAMLKSFPFFDELSNWFLPFDTGFSAINELFESEDKSILSAFVGNNIMCNSDKFSFCLSVMQMPEKQRNNLKFSFKEESEQLKEIANDEALLTPGYNAKNISKQYIQDLFRFFKLHPQHAEFSDMFASSLFMHKSYLFDILSSNSDLKSSIAEYYFLKGHYNEAIELFTELITESEPTAALYQKTGFSYQQTSQIANALDAYLKADLIHPDDLWTIRKIALCYRLSGNYAKALEYYQHADFLKPDQLNTAMHIGQCLIQLGKYKEALNVYYKLDAENEGNVKIMRSISWCAFISCNLTQASYYSKKLIENSPEAQDYINAGHIAWCQKRRSDAIDFYQSGFIFLDNNLDKFVSILNEDKKYLLLNGIGEDEYLLLLDEFLFVNFEH